MLTAPDPKPPAKLFPRILDPMDRISEVLFVLIMALTFTCTLGLATVDTIQIRTMLIGALGCNLDWGIIDGGVYLLARLSERGRNLLNWRTIRKAEDNAEARRVIADALTSVFASVMSPDHM